MGAWNLKVREGLIEHAVHDKTCANGSWDPASARSAIIGPRRPWSAFHT